MLQLLENQALGVWDKHVHTAIFKMDNQQGTTIWHMELCSVLRGSLEVREIWERMDTCACMAESFAVHLKLSHIVNWLYPNTKYKVKKPLKPGTGSGKTPEPTGGRCIGMQLSKDKKLLSSKPDFLSL